MTPASNRASASTAPPATSTGSAAPGRPLYDDPSGAAQTAYRAALAQGRTGDAAVLAALQHPTATWLTGAADDGDRARSLTTAAQAAGATPVLVLYDVPHRDCGSYSAGGAPDDGAYGSWITSIAAGIGARPAVVVLEPDAVAQAISGCAGLSDPGARYALLARAVATLTASGGTRVYLDAGGASWVTDTGALARALSASGVARAAGFSLNVAGFETTEASTAYGRRVSDALGGAHFVIDTSRNGAGPAGPGTSGPSWCNPPGRRLGRAPTATPGLDRVDALLWVKRPGESDGACRAGDPPAGTFSLSLARGLVG